MYSLNLKHFAGENILHSYRHVNLLNLMVLLKLVITVQ